MRHVIPAEHPLFERLPADKSARIEYLRDLKDNMNVSRGVRVEALARFNMEFPFRPLSPEAKAWVEGVARQYVNARR